MYNSESIYVIKNNSQRNAAIFNDVISGFKQIVVSLLWGIVGSPCECFSKHWALIGDAYGLGKPCFDFEDFIRTGVFSYIPSGIDFGSQVVFLVQ